jgi:hypothetical protein
METVLQTEVNTSDQKSPGNDQDTAKEIIIKHVQEFVPTCIVDGNDSSDILRHCKKLFLKKKALWN